MIKAVSNNFGWKVVSLCVAALLWFVVVSSQNPIRTEVFQVPLSIHNMHVFEYNNLVLLNEGELTSRSLGISLRGTRSDLDMLRMASSSFTAFIDPSPVDISQTTSIGPMDIHVRYSFPPNIQESRYTIMSPPETVTLMLDRLVSENFPILVESDGDVMPGFTTQTSGIWPENVEVSGPESIVDSIDRLQINIDLTQADSDISQFYYIQVVDEQGTDITSRLRLSSPNVLAQVSITPYGEATLLPPEVIGSASEGFVLAGITLDTDTITVVGDDVQIAALQASGLQLRPVNIEGRSVSYEVRHDLEVYLENLDLSIRNLTPSEVIIMIDIEPLISLEFEISVDSILTVDSSGNVVDESPDFVEDFITVELSLPYSMGEHLSAEHLTLGLVLANANQSTMPLQVGLPSGAYLLNEPYVTIATAILGE